MEYKAWSSKEPEMLRYRRENSMLLRDFLRVIPGFAGRMTLRASNA